MSRLRTYPIPKIGHRTGKYVVIEEATNTQKILCQCDCGTKRYISSYHLRNRPNISCGCDVRKRISERKVKHGSAKRGNQTHEYMIWAAMMRRCYNPKVERYQYYGGRGIKVCEHWHTFENFLTDMGSRPSTKHTIGRKDNNVGYEPTNCNWETTEEQMNNRSNNVYIQHNDQRLTIAQWARKLNVPYWKIQRQKKNGVSDSDIIQTYTK